MMALPTAAMPMRTVSAMVHAMPSALRKAARFPGVTAMMEQFTAAQITDAASVTEPASRFIPLSGAAVIMDITDTAEIIYHNCSVLQMSKNRLEYIFRRFLQFPQVSANFRMIPQAL